MTIVASYCPECKRKTAQEIYMAKQRANGKPWVYGTKLCLSCGNYIDMVTSWEKTPETGDIKPLQSRE